LTKEEQAKIRNELRLLAEFGHELVMPHARRIKGKLWELQPGNMRFFYFIYIEQRFVILHRYRKQSQKAPQQEVDLAMKRMKELMDEVSCG
jgi:phage-related protein